MSTSETEQHPPSKVTPIRVDAESPQVDAEQGNSPAEQNPLLMLLPLVAQVVGDVAKSPGLQALAEAHAKRATVDAELMTLRQSQEHERQLDSQKRYWEYYGARDRHAVRIWLALLATFVVLAFGTVYAIYMHVIDSQNAFTLGGLIAVAMGWAGNKVASRPPPPKPA